MKAAEQGDTDAQTNLGNCYKYGRGVPQSYEKAAEWFREAAEQGDADAQYNLSLCYYRGQGVEQSYEKTMEWLRKAVAQNHAAAQNMLGVCYKRGHGVPQSAEKGAEWHLKAAEQGASDAQYNMGLAYENGDGVEQDYKKAEEWYRKAAGQGDEDAVKALKKLRKKQRKFGCFITTATCLSRGKGDDCYELTMFRRFRDNWLAAREGGSALIEEYYHIAPPIVERIDALPGAGEIYRGIWQDYLAECLALIEEGQFDICKERYVRMVRELQRRFPEE